MKPSPRDWVNGNPVILVSLLLDAGHSIRGKCFQEEPSSLLHFLTSPWTWVPPYWNMLLHTLYMQWEQYTTRVQQHSTLAIATSTWSKTKASIIVQVMSVLSVIQGIGCLWACGRRGNEFQILKSPTKVLTKGHERHVKALSALSSDSTVDLLMKSLHSPQTVHVPLYEFFSLELCKGGIWMLCSNFYGCNTWSASNIASIQRKRLTLWIAFAICHSGQLNHLQKMLLKPTWAYRVFAQVFQCQSSQSWPALRSIATEKAKSS